MTQSMNITDEVNGHTWTVHVQNNRLDAQIAVTFKDYMKAKISDGHHQIVLDLSKVGFVDSSGLGAIVTALKVLGDNGTMVLLGVQPPVMEIFRLTRMDRIFKMFDESKDALNSFE